jgi:hypothetical protein
MSQKKKAFDMTVRKPLGRFMSLTAKDGQHRHGHQHAVIEVGDEGLELVARHVRHCEKGPDEGACKVKHIKDKK